VAQLLDWIEIKPRTGPNSVPKMAEFRAFDRLRCEDGVLRYRGSRTTLEQGAFPAELAGEAGDGAGFKQPDAAQRVAVADALSEVPHLLQLKKSGGQ
jgi:hypothetical protein